MSLTDALLLEGYRDPREVWIALRSDGQKGSGTVNDPYDGGTKLGSSISITNLVNTGTEATATNHGFLVGDVVTIAGVTGGGAADWNGTFVIFTTGATTFKYTMAAEPAAGASGSITAAKVVYRFDDIMRPMPENTLIHLGRGVFETRGFDPGRSEQLNWTIRAGQRILGSGMGVTTLKLMHAVPFVPSVTSQQLTLAMGHSWNTSPYIANVDHFEVSDLTVDCNMRSQITDRVAKAAVLAFGRHVRIRRVRAVDYCTQSSPVECFVLSTAGADPRISATGADPGNPFTERVDCRIEDCVLEQPGLNGLYTITGMLLAGGEEPAGGLTGFHRACVERNNYINFEFQDNPVSIAGVTIASGTATVTTRTPHGRDTGDYVVISGALVDGSELNTFNGSYQIVRLNDTQFTYSPGWPVPVTNPTGDMWVGRYSSRFLAIADLEMVSPPSRIVRLSTTRPHNRIPSNYVNVSGVKVDLALDDRFNGRFPVKSVTSPTQLDPTYQLEFEIAVEVEATPDFSTVGLLGSGLQALSGEGGTEAIVEGNRVFHCWVGGPYHDTWASGDLVLRNNYYHDVLTGPYQSIGPGVSTTNEGIALNSLQNSGTTAIAETFKPHGLRAITDRVNISGASIPAYNRTDVRVDAVPTSTTFEYSLTSNPGGSTTGASYLSIEQRKLIESLTRAADGTGYIVTAKTTYAKHGFAKGDAIEIIKAGHFNLTQYPQSTLYNGSFTITDVPDEKTFCYRITSDPGVDSSNADFAAGYFGRIWQSRISIYEDNVIELSSRFGDEGTPSAIGLSQSYNEISRTEPYTYVQMMARDNLVRPVDERYGLVHSSLSSAVRFNSCEKALVAGNVVDLDYPTPINFARSGAVQTRYNQTSAGAPISGLDYDTNRRTDDIATVIEDIETLSLL